jgi:hypothetical protein
MALLKHICEPRAAKPAYLMKKEILYSDYKKRETPHKIVTTDSYYRGTGSEPLLSLFYSQLSWFQTPPEQRISQYFPTFS